MRLFHDKKWLLVIYMVIALLAGMSNFMEPANLFVLVSISLSLLVVLAGDKMAHLYLLLALCPFYTSLRISGIYVGFVIPLMILFKLITKRSTISSPILVFLSFIFLFVWFLHDVQFVTLANAIFRLLVPACIFLIICKQRLDNYDGYYAMWIVVLTSIIAMISVFLVQGGSLDAFINASYAGEMRLGEADVDDCQKNQLGGAMGFPIYTIIVVSLFFQMLMTHSFKLWKKVSIIWLGTVLFFITFLTISRVYILGLLTLLLLLFLHMLKSKSVKTIIGLVVGAFIIYVIASVYLPEYMDNIFDSYLTRQMSHTDHGGTGIRGAIFEDCVKYLTEDMECLLVGKGSSAYPLYGAKIHRLFSFSAHNMILDSFMAFGILGTLILLSLYIHLYRRERLRTGIRWSIFRVMPLACYLMMNMTATPFLLDKTYPLLLFLIMNIIHCTDNSEYEPKWDKNNSINYKQI